MAIRRRPLLLFGAAAAAAVALAAGSRRPTASYSGPANFTSTETSFGNASASAGAMVQVKFPITNAGGAAATPTVGGGIALNGERVATWSIVGTAPTVQPGETVQLTVQTIVPPNAAGDTLTGIITITP